jgi:hypothetical protein
MEDNVEHAVLRSCGPLVALCAALGACGGTPPPGQPGPVPPTPTPGPTPAAAVFLHVLQPPYLRTYEVDEPTGRLHRPVEQNLGDAQVLTSDPRGRYLYAADGGCPDEGFPSCCASRVTVAQYAPDVRDGTLARKSEVTVFEQSVGAWRWLSGGMTRLHGFRVSRWGTTCRHTTYSYLSIELDSDGQLGAVSTSEYFESDDDPGRAVVDVRSDMLYKAGRSAEWGGLGGLAAHAIRADGQLNQTGWTDLCVATAMEPFYNEYDPSSPKPLVAARGFLFAAVPVPPERRTVCSYEGPRLKPLANLGFVASVAEAFVPPSVSQAVLLAMGVEVPAGKATRNELRVYSMNSDGALQLRGSADLMRDVQQVVFHPSGRFLYVSDTADTLLGYAIGPDGRLDLVETIDHAGGGMAITTPQAGT